MATSIIKPTTNISGNQYCKMLDGTLICWGTDIFTDYMTVQFPQAFTQTPRVIASWGFHTEATVSGDIPALKTYAVTTTNFASTIGGAIPSGMSGKLRVNWIAIGR